MKKIFIVDDEPTNLEISKAYLQSRYHVTSFSTAEDCLKRLASELPDLLLLDNLMPGMNGVDLCRQLKDNLAYQSLPVVVVSAFADQSHIDEAFKCGATDYLTKPFFENDLLALVEKHIQ